MALPVNDLGAWTVGQLYPTWELPLVRDNRVMDLTGVTANQLSMILYTAAKTIAGNSPGVGTFVINSSKPGVVTYTQASGDMIATVSYLKVRINFNGVSPDYSDFIRISISN